MIPYDNFSFFLWLLIPIIPAIILGLVQASPKIRSLWIMHLSLGMLYIILSPLSFFIQAVVYFIWEYVIVRSYLGYRQSETKKNQAYVFYLAVVGSLLPLLLVKFVPLLGLSHLAQTLVGNPATNVLAAQKNGLQSQMTPLLNSVLGFLGISYVTFRIVGTVTEIRDGLIKEVNLGDFISFVLFFPTLASGPIDRYRRFLADLTKELTRQEYISYLIEGIEYVFRGFLYKFILAYLINQYALIPINHAHGLWPTIQYMYAYSAYFFFDFAGYSAFAIGVSRFFGIKTPDNFKAPFCAKNIKDFWNRWHISLSMWFRDYIYMRFALDSAKRRRFSNRSTASAVSYLLLFFLMGIWHGTQWHYIIYGLYMALLMIGFEFLERLNKKKQRWGEGKAWDMLAMFFTLQFTCFGLLIFSGHFL